MPTQSACRSAVTQADALADRMLEILSEQPPTHSGSYPMTLGQLARLADPTAKTAFVIKVAGSKRFSALALVARGKDLLAPLTLKSELPQLAESDQTLRYLLDLRAKNKTRAHTVASLKNQLTSRCAGELRKRFQASVTRQVGQGKLPPDVGCVVAGGGRPHLFRLQDLEPSAWRAAIEKSQSNLQSTSTNLPPETADFSAEFESVFEQLDRAQGSFNFVALEELRTSLPRYSREEFDGQLRELRLARRYRLSAAENRSDVSVGQRDAGIREAGSLLLYAQRTKR